MTTDDSLPELEIGANGLPTAVTTAEAYVLDEIETGETIVVSVGHDPADPSVWNHDQAIRATFLRYICLHSDKLNIPPKGISIAGALITGILDLESASLKRPLWILESRLDAPTILRDATTCNLSILRCHTPGLLADGLTVNGSLKLNGSTFLGHVRLLGANISSDLNIHHTTLENPDEIALAADGLKVCGNMFFNNVTALNEVRLPQADIGGTFHCIGSSFQNLNGNAFNADNLTVQKNLIFRNNKASGQVRFTNAVINGALECIDTTFETLESKINFDARKLKVSGDVTFADVTAYGEIRLSGANIGGTLTLHECSINNPTGDAFNGERMTVTERFFWWEFVSPPTGQLRLTHATVGDFGDDGSGWPKAGELFIDGFTYDRLNRSLSIADHIKWIGLMANKRNGQAFFYNQPWEQTRKVYRDEGDADAVRQVNMAYDAAKAQFQVQTANRVRKLIVGPFYVLYDKLMGYGHDLFRVWPWILGCMAVFFVWSWFAYHQGAITPTASRIFMNECYFDLSKSNCNGWELHERTVYVGNAPDPLIDTLPMRLPQGYPAFHSALYTLDTFIPFADLHQENYWTVTDDGPWGEWMRAIFTAFIALGGSLSAIFAAGMLNLIRKN